MRSVLGPSLSAHWYGKVALLTPGCLIRSFHPLGHQEERAHLKVTRSKRTLRLWDPVGVVAQEPSMRLACDRPVSELIMETRQKLPPTVIGCLNPGVGKDTEPGEVAGEPPTTDFLDSTPV